jgi:predicted esterase
VDGGLADADGGLADADGGLADADAADGGRCAGVPPLGPDGAVPPAPPHEPLGEDVEVPGDRPVYVLPGDAGDSRVIVYLHGMCGDVTAADYFREAVRAHGTLIALRGDTPCQGVRFKWRADSATIQARVRAAFKRVNELRGGALRLERALLFGYSQGADRAEKLAQRFPRAYPRIVLGGAPMKASPTKLAAAERVAFLGGELETTETMRAGFEALERAGITSRFFTLECAYHGYFGTNAEAQLAEVLTWVSAP